MNRTTDAMVQKIVDDMIDVMEKTAKTALLSPSEAINILLISELKTMHRDMELIHMRIDDLVKRVDHYGKKANE